MSSDKDVLVDTGLSDAEDVSPAPPQALPLMHLDKKSTRHSPILHTGEDTENTTVAASSHVGGSNADILVVRTNLLGALGHALISWFLSLLLVHHSQETEIVVPKEDDDPGTLTTPASVCNTEVGSKNLAGDESPDVSTLSTAAGSVVYLVEDTTEVVAPPAAASEAHSEARDMAATPIVDSKKGEDLPVASVQDVVKVATTPVASPEPHSGARIVSAISTVDPKESELSEDRPIAPADSNPSLNPEGHNSPRDGGGHPDPSVLAEDQPKAEFPEQTTDADIEEKLGFADEATVDVGPPKQAQMVEESRVSSEDVMITSLPVEVQEAATQIGDSDALQVENDAIPADEGTDIIQSEDKEDLPTSNVHEQSNCPEAEHVAEKTTLIAGAASGMHQEIADEPSACSEKEKGEPLPADPQESGVQSREADMEDGAVPSHESAVTVDSTELQAVNVQVSEGETVKVELEAPVVDAMTTKAEVHHNEVTDVVGKDTPIEAVPSTVAVYAHEEKDFPVEQSKPDVTLEPTGHEAMGHEVLEDVSRPSDAAVKEENPAPQSVMEVQDTSNHEEAAKNANPVEEMTADIDTVGDVPTEIVAESLIFEGTEKDASRDVQVQDSSAHFGDLETRSAEIEPVHSDVGAIGGEPESKEGLTVDAQTLEEVMATIESDLVVTVAISGAEVYHLEVAEFHKEALPVEAASHSDVPFASGDVSELSDGALGREDPVSQSMTQTQEQLTFAEAEDKQGFAESATVASSQTQTDTVNEAPTFAEKGQDIALPVEVQETSAEMDTSESLPAKAEDVPADAGAEVAKPEELQTANLQKLEKEVTAAVVGPDSLGDTDTTSDVEAQHPVASGRESSPIVSVKELSLEVKSATPEGDAEPTASEVDVPGGLPTSSLATLTDEGKTTASEITRLDVESSSIPPTPIDGGTHRTVISRHEELSESVSRFSRTSDIQESVVSAQLESSPFTTEAEAPTPEALETQSYSPELQMPVVDLAAEPPALPISDDGSVDTQFTEDAGLDVSEVTAKSPASREASVTATSQEVEGLLLEPTTGAQAGPRDEVEASLDKVDIENEDKAPVEPFNNTRSTILDSEAIRNPEVPVVLPHAGVKEESLFSESEVSPLQTATVDDQVWDGAQAPDIEMSIPSNNPVLELGAGEEELASKITLPNMTGIAVPIHEAFKADLQWVAETQVLDATSGSVVVHEAEIANGQDVHFFFCNL
jgi:hypothetical protein